MASDRLARPIFEEFVSIDRVVHEPARLAILTALSACDSADYVFLQRLTGLQSGSLTQHLARLEEAGLVTIAKGFAGKYPQTTVALTKQGRKAISDHWAQIDSLKRARNSWARSKR